jgi:hypothetical protein
LNKSIKYFLIILSFKTGKSHAEIANYVNNGSFESVLTIPTSPHYLPKFWSATDTTMIFGEVLSKINSPIKVPLSSYTYQWPKSGNNHLISLQYCSTCPYNKRGYPRNRLKQVLQAGKVYCVTMYVNLSNHSTHAISEIGAYFSDNSIDTITKCNIPITYLTPQVQNPVNNLILDTLNWVAISGTFVATGVEKYMFIGNFKSDTATTTTLVNPTNLPTNAASYSYDDISVIELNLAAHAGPNKAITPGDSAYIGRELDFSTDTGCVWYQLPNMATPIATISGLWVKPTTTTTYVVRQQLPCSSEKWDTVVIYMNPVGLNKLVANIDQLKVYPVPAQDFLEIVVSSNELIKDFKTISIYNSLGQLVREEELLFEGNKMNLKTANLSEGVYTFQLKSDHDEIVIKRFVISR